jgi:DNA-binding FadR family transcriptional regulator
VSQGARTRVVRTDGAGRNPDLASPFAINRYDLPSVHGARLLAERAVVAEVAERIDAATLARLETSLAAQKHCLDDPVRFLICDREFHSAIYGCSSNALLSDFVIGLYTYLMEHRRTAMSQPGAILRSFKDHSEILAGLRARDAAAVVAAFERHLDHIYNTTRAILDTMERDASATTSAEAE